MKVSKVKVYDIKESIEASKYPMAIDTSAVNDEVTERTIKLARSGKKNEYT